MKMKQHRTYEVRTPGRLTKTVVCDELKETAEHIEFWLDGSPQTVLVLRVPRQGTEWQLKADKGRRPGVKNSFTLRGALTLARSAKKLIR